MTHAHRALRAAGRAPAAPAAGPGRRWPAPRPRPAGGRGAGARCRALRAPRSTRPRRSTRALQTETGAPPSAARHKRNQSARVRRLYVPVGAGLAREAACVQRGAAPRLQVNEDHLRRKRSCACVRVYTRWLPRPRCCAHAHTPRYYYGRARSARRFVIRRFCSIFVCINLHKSQRRPIVSIPRVSVPLPSSV
jgi:hypothetical protein